jgi:hypothetical protein
MAAKEVTASSGMQNFQVLFSCQGATATTRNRTRKNKFAMRCGI